MQELFILALTAINRLTGKLETCMTIFQVELNINNALSYIYFSGITVKNVEI
jgi:hypothetical protein